jgi:uroporphyrin-III C-methyltransferase / precorrin-2 dehydrogenase / sirohydrochlorin ferrochelatase
MRFLPVFLDLARGTVALVGTGPAALAKLRLLQAAGANVRWYSESAAVAAAQPAGTSSGRLELSSADPLQADFSGFVAVVSAAGGALDEAVAACARARNIPVNVVDRPDLSTFIVPAVVDRGDVVVAIGTSGASPVLARRVREWIEAVLPARLGELAALLSRYRVRFASARHKTVSPRQFWERVVDGPIAQALLAGRPQVAETALARAISDAALPNKDKDGMVSLVGAGPGDPDLLTLRALRALQCADVIFYDDLVTEAVLDRARRDAERVFVGKRRGHPGIGQEEINHRLVEEARRGRNVVRLKGGDPFIFGRGGEELDHLREASIPTVVVPGITAALGCAAEAGLPLTHRNEATRLTFVTAHRADDAAATDWSTLADPQTTVVVYMGLASASAVRDGLIAAGRDPKTPAGVLARGTQAGAKTVVGSLDNLAALALQAGEGPAVLVIGEVVARSDAWRAAERLLSQELAA